MTCDVLRNTAEKKSLQTFLPVRAENNEVWLAFARYLEDSCSCFALDNPATCFESGLFEKLRSPAGPIPGVLQPFLKPCRSLRSVAWRHLGRYGKDQWLYDTQNKSFRVLSMQPSGRFLRRRVRIFGTICRKQNLHGVAPSRFLCHPHPSHGSEWDHSNAYRTSRETASEHRGATSGRRRKLQR